MMKMKVNNTDIDDRQKTNFDKKKTKKTPLELSAQMN